MIKNFENYKIFEWDESIDLDIYYEVRYYDNSLQEEIIVGDDETDYNPFDIKDIVKVLIKYEHKGYSNLYIVKIKKEKVDDSIISKIRLKIEAEKYNL